MRRAKTFEIASGEKTLRIFKNFREAEA